ncbi:uncharacterized protein LOC134835252 [Culicoides brevitarsis]|uniref:uncharacterized protein LOC134835252 n=1 Tax=Culicoides brevitarsis TaxID=469753 RepID=UPI00307C49C3
MPFVKRVVQPKYICRKSKAPGQQAAASSSEQQQQTPGDSLVPCNNGIVQDYELETITNVTLSNALRQLASLLLISNEIFSELNKELETISDRSAGLKQRIEKLAEKVDNDDPKLVPVPESDLITFANIKNHYKRKHEIQTSLFTPETRTDTLKEMYEAAAKTPVPVMDELDRILGENRRRSSDAFMCTPVLGQIRRRMKSKVDLEIEARMPTAIENLRKWTSQEAIGDITVGPDGVSRVFSTSSSINNSQFANMSRDETDDTLHSTYNNSSAVTSRSNTNDSLNDATLDHRLPSPEEQQKIIALKYPAETIRVDVSGKRFDRMSAARKSLLHVQMGGTTGTPVETEDGAESGGDTIRRRARSRKPRGKRRNTIAGIDGKEIEEAANGGESHPEDQAAIDLVPRSKSSDILKKDEKSRLSHFNTLKQWGRNRLRQITLRSNDNNERQLPPIDKQVSDIDNFNTQDTMRQNNAFRKRQLEKEKERKLSHERKPSYSSQSEKSVAAVSSLSTIPVNPVKLRESSLIRRQRRHGLGQKEEQNSSSGNWSASSESGRTSIGSEITTTTHPKSSASSGSLNHHHLHGGSSGPPSSIISRRRFLNTSASSSITSEGTATPDLQTFGDFHDEGETSSIYSCDTEGYYTSFHMDSGLKTLKEEEPATPLHNSQNLSSTTSFESSGNQTVISPENEYELFGRGSTSTTTSSAGTICTIVPPNDYEQRSNASVPQVPERKSSLTKLNRSSSSVSNSNAGTLERSYSSSTVGSTLERMGTIKRNGVLLQKEVQTIVKEEALSVARTESPDSGNNTSSSPIESNSSPTQSAQGVRSNSEFEYSESSDLECVDRIERIRVKTTINTSRIPSMCVITPGNSDDDEGMKNRKNSDSSEDREGPQVIEIAFGDETPMNEKVFKKATLLPLGNFMGKLKGVLHKKSPNKHEDEIYAAGGEYVTIADVANNNKKRDSGVYFSNDVVKRNLATVLSGNLNEETEYVSLNELPCNIRCESNLLSSDGTDAVAIDENTTRENAATTNTMSKNETEGKSPTRDEENRIKGARVTLDAHGKVVYNSDSLKRRKGAHTTFAPGPNVKDTKTSEAVASETARSEDDKDDDEYIEIPPAISSPLLSGGVLNRKLNQVRPVKRLNSPIIDSVTNSNNNMRGAYVNLQEAQAGMNPLMTQSNYTDYIGNSNEGKLSDSSSDKYKLTPVQLFKQNSKIGFSPKQQKRQKFSLPPSPLTIEHYPYNASERENENVDPNNSSENGVCVVKRSNSYRLANNVPSTPAMVLKNPSFASIRKSRLTTVTNPNDEVIPNEKIINNTSVINSFNNTSPLIPTKTHSPTNSQTHTMTPIWSPKNKLYKELTAISHKNSEAVSPHVNNNTQNGDSAKGKPRIYDKSRHVHHRNKNKKQISIHSISSPIAGTLIRRSKTDEGFASLDDEEDVTSSNDSHGSDQSTSNVEDKKSDEKILETNFELYDIPRNLPVPQKELVEDEEDSDDDDEDIFYTPSKILKPIIYSITPSKLTIPSDSSQHRARILSSNGDNCTDICFACPCTYNATKSSDCHPEGRQDYMEGLRGIVSDIGKHVFGQIYYQLSSHDPHFNGGLMTQSSYISSTLPRFQNSPIYESPPVTYSTIGMDPMMQQQFKRNDQMYWTLQSAGRKSRFNTYGLTDDLNMAQSDIPIEQLYSTPNKLRTTRHGFDNYFSPVPSVQDSHPVGKVHESKSRDDSLNKISPIDPRNTGPGFQTSTPAKADNGLASPTKGLSEELRNRLRLGDSGARSSGNSPINSGRSTPRLEPQARTRHSWASQNAQVPETCADRMKQPKTSLMDFKRLLLEKQATNAATKKSAVEQLLMQKQQQQYVPQPAPASPTTAGPKAINSSMHILDLSGSPKTFATRRMLRQGNFGTSSPVKSNAPKHVSPKTGWRYNNLRSDVISTAIPEVNSEEDNSPNNSAQRQLLKNNASPPKAPSPREPEDDRVVVEEKMSVRDNIFLKTEENNFMKHELLQNKQPVTGIYSRAHLQAQRAQFLLGGNANPTNGAKSLINSKFKDQAATSPTSASATVAATDAALPTLETSL